LAGVRLPEKLIMGYNTSMKKLHDFIAVDSLILPYDVTSV